MILQIESLKIQLLILSVSVGVILSCDINEYEVDQSILLLSLLFNLRGWAA